jgi:predicted branched-subunit amino acid permease
MSALLLLEFPAYLHPVRFIVCAATEHPFIRRCTAYCTAQGTILFSPFILLARVLPADSDAHRLARRQAAQLGMRAVAPHLLALSAWGFVSGVAMVNYGLSFWQSMIMSLWVYAGSAQLTALPLMAAGAPVWMVFLAGFIVNIRFVIFGATLYPFFERYSHFKRLMLGYLLTDINYVVFVSLFRHVRQKRRTVYVWTYLSMGTAIAAAWQLSTLAGVLIGDRVPREWSLEFAGVLTLMAVVIPLIKGRPMLVTVLVAGGVAWLGQALPLRMGLFIAIVAGIAAGILSEKAMTKGMRI